MQIKVLSNNKIKEVSKVHTNNSVISIVETTDGCIYTNSKECNIYMYEEIKEEFKTVVSSKVGNRYRVSFTYNNKYYTFVFRKSKIACKPTYIRNLSREYAPFKFDNKFIDYLKSIINKEM